MGRRHPRSCVDGELGSGPVRLGRRGRFSFNLLLVGRGVGSEIASPERLHSLSPSLCWLGSVSIPESLGTGLLMLRSPSGAIVEQGNDLRVLVVLEAGDRRDHARDNYSASYRKLHDTPWLVASDIRDDPDSPIRKYTFRARAWTAANDKARELGWIV